jgi:hypothetical protein
MFYLLFRIVTRKDFIFLFIIIIIINNTGTNANTTAQVIFDIIVFTMQVFSFFIKVA